MRWHGQPGFKLVAVKDVRRLTGLEPSELLRRSSIQQLTRIGKSGAREEFLRLPVELLIEEPTDCEQQRESTDEDSGDDADTGR